VEFCGVPIVVYDLVVGVVILLFAIIAKQETVVVIKVANGIPVVITMFSASKQRFSKWPSDSSYER
jgi:hypothetical protein